MKAKIFIIVFLLFLFCFSFSRPAFAVTISIVDYPPSISIDPFTITASISGAATGTNYLRVSLYKDGTDNYFGETYNGSDWYDGSDGVQYLSIAVVKGSTTSAVIQARVANPDSTKFTGDGTYKLKIRRYTNSGSYASTDTQAPVDVIVSIPTSTPTPTNTPSPTPTNTPIPTPVPTSTPTPTNVPTPTKTPTPTIIPTSKPTSTPSPTQKPSLAPLKITGKLAPTSILGLSTNSAIVKPSPQKPKSKSQAQSNTSTGFPFLIVSIAGSLLFIACAILTTLKIRKKKE